MSARGLPREFAKVGTVRGGAGGNKATKRGYNLFYFFDKRPPVYGYSVPTYYWSSVGGNRLKLYIRG